MISIIMLDYKSFHHTINCLESLKTIYNIKKPNFEVLLLDNGNNYSQAQSSRIKKDFPFVFLKHSKINLGFALGNQILVKYTIGEYLLFLNNDTIVKDLNFLKKMANLLKKRKDIFAVSPLIYYGNSDNPWFTGGIYKKYSPIMFSHQEKIKNYNEKYIKVDYCSGCAIMVRAEDIKALTYIFDPKLFLNEEETELSIRVRQTFPKKIFVLMIDTPLDHFVGGSMAKTLHIYYIIRNRIYLIFRHYQSVDRFILLINALVFSFGFIKYLKLQRSSLFKLIYYAVKDGLKFGITSNKYKYDFYPETSIKINKLENIK